MAAMLFHPGPFYNRAMTSLRRHRVFTVLFALCSLLFMQLALAGYSCPGFESRVQEIAAMAEAHMPCAGSMSMVMDDEQPALCHAHCQSAQPATDSQPLQVPVLAVDNGSFPLAPVIGELRERVPPLASLLARATAPPLSIRNCCLRI
jgi:hypothetical protein